MSFCGLVAHCRFVERMPMRKVLAENKQFTMHALAVGGHWRLRQHPLHTCL
jgi:hypothetical protein